MTDSDRFSPQSFFQQIKEARLRAEALVDGLSPQQLIKRPHPAKWSIAECLLHLNATGTIVQSFMADAIARGKRDNTLGTAPFDIGFKGRLFVWLAEPPPRIRLIAPRRVRPPARVDDPLKLLPAFLKVQDDWERLIKESEGLNLARIKIAPRFSAFRARLAAAMPWMLAHQRRHLWQAENVKRQILSTASHLSAQAG
jgi:DinB family protein